MPISRRTQKHGGPGGPVRRVLAGAAAVLVLAPTLLTAAVDDAGERYVVVRTRKALTISGEAIDGALIVIRAGRIEAVGKKVEYPGDSRLVDASDLVVMPGLINPRSKLGLPPVRRSGNQSHKKTADLFYPPDDDTYEKLLAAGYTLLGLYTDGSGLPGQTLVQTTYRPKPRAGIKDSGLVRVTFSRTARDKKTLRAALKAAAEQITREKKATTRPAAKSRPTTGPASRPSTGPASRPATGPATRPTTGPAPPKVRPELAPLVSLLKKTDGFMAHVELGRASDLLHFAEVAGDLDFPRAYLFAGRTISDVHHVIGHDLLGGADALVVLPPTMPNMPLTANPYNPGRLFAAAGCKVAFFPASDTVPGHENMRARLALLVRGGLRRGDALKAVTLHAAEILAIAKDYGSIEKGKRADLIFLDGDPLDPFSRVRRVMIHGKMVLNREKPRHRR